MKLVRQSRLQLHQKGIIQLYEVDICELGAAQFVVNFRYGKKDEPLKESTKTVFPVAWEQATQVFEKTVTDQLKKGYQDAASPQVEEEASEIPKEATENLREEVILGYFKTLFEERKWRESWSLSRAIWRVGELRIKACAPYILKLLRGEDHIMQVIGQHIRGKEVFVWYSAIWALGRCEEQAAIPILKKLAFDEQQDPMIQRFAKQAVILLAEGQELKAMEAQLIATLPSGIKSALLADNQEDIVANLRDYLFEVKSTDNQYLTTLYILSHQKETLEKALLTVLPTIPLKPNYFKHIRYIFKLAEFRDDIAVFSQLAYRFEKESAHFQHHYWGNWVDNEWVKAKDELPKANSRLAYSDRTKHYFRSRVVKRLTRLGEAKEERYVPFATALLLTISDQDLSHSYSYSNWSYDWNAGTSSVTYTHFDENAKLDYFNQILYDNSPRYKRRTKGDWVCVAPYEPGKAVPETREEAHADLWDAEPEAYITLLCKSKCKRVHAFAVKALKQHPKMKKLLTIDALTQLFAVPYEETLTFALDFAKSNYDPNQPDTELILALATCGLEDARRLAIEWIAAQENVFLKEVTFTKHLLLTDHADVRAWVRQTLPLVALSTEVATELVQVLLQEINTFQVADQKAAVVQDISELLLSVFPKRLAALAIEQVMELLAAPLPEVQHLAGKIMLLHDTPSDQLPPEMLDALLHSTHEEVQAVGIELFGTLPIEFLAQKRDFIINLAVSKRAAVRLAVQPIIGKLAAENQDFAHQAIEALLPILFRKEKVEGMHDSIYQLLSSQLGAQLNHVNKEGLWKLLTGSYQRAQELGAVLLTMHYQLTDFAVKELVTLADHELLQLRQAVWESFEQNIDRMRYEREASLKLLEVKWDDSRAFAFRFFAQHFRKEDWTPALLVSVCDSTNEAVQTFGYGLITKFFEEKDGEEYLMKLSQHPSSNLQLFATNYLERFAQGNLERLKQLQLYFITVLSQVNKSRVAKDRVFNFLRQEGLKDRTTAQFVQEILNRQAATMAIGDKATCISILNDLRQAHPHLSTNLKVKEVRTYGA